METLRNHGSTIGLDHCLSLAMANCTIQQPGCHPNFTISQRLLIHRLLTHVALVGTMLLRRGHGNRIENRLSPLEKPAAHQRLEIAEKGTVKRMPSTLCFGELVYARLDRHFMAMNYITIFTSAYPIYLCIFIWFPTDVTARQLAGFGKMGVAEFQTHYTLHRW